MFISHYVIRIQTTLKGDTFRKHSGLLGLLFASSCADLNSRHCDVVFRQLVDVEFIVVYVQMCASFFPSFFSLSSYLPTGVVPFLSGGR